MSASGGPVDAAVRRCARDLVRFVRPSLLPPYFTSPCRNGDHLGFGIIAAKQFCDLRPGRRRQFIGGDGGNDAVAFGAPC